MSKVFRNRRKSNEEQIDELLSAYLDGVLASQERQMLETRLRQEPTLVARLDGLRQTKRALANLPQVGIPRNFILSPSMVAPRKPVTRPRQRRTWPVFGWATAAVTLLFLLVFAGDLIVVKPTPPRPTQVVAQQFRLAVEATLEAESPPDVLEMAPVQAEVTSELGVEEKAAPAAEVPKELAEQEAPTEVVVEKEIVVEAEAPEPAAEAKAASEDTAATADAGPVAGEGAEPPSGEEGERMLQASAAPTEEAETGFAQETLGVPATPTPAPEGTAPPSTPVTPEAEVAENERSPLASPMAEQEKAELAEPTRTPDAVASALAMVTPAVADTTQTEDDVRFWLRLAEFGLGVAVVGLALVTLVLRLREG